MFYNPFYPSPIFFCQLVNEMAKKEDITDLQRKKADSEATQQLSPKK
jgi:hypothetical protein